MREGPISCQLTSHIAESKGNIVVVPLPLFLPVNYVHSNKFDDSCTFTISRDETHHFKLCRQQDIFVLTRMSVGKHLGREIAIERTCT